MQKFNLDWSIYSAKDRLAAIEKIPLEKLNQTELETVTNYVLYGKDEDGTSTVDRKEIQIKTKFSSYQKEKTVSLDEMLENPAFDENILQKERTIYKNVKPALDKEKLSKVPGIQELWADINKIKSYLEQNQGKKPFEEGTPHWSQKQIYYYQHYLIDLYKQQYYFMDGFFPTIQTQGNRLHFYGNSVDFQGNYPFLPRGLMREEKDFDFESPRNSNREIPFESYSDQDLELLEKSGKPFIDFRKQEHIYQLVQHYEEIKDMVENQPDSILNNLIWTLDFYIEKAGLSEQQKLIVDCKKRRLSNKEIAAELLEKLGIYHQENYISTIWNKCVKLICAAVELNYDEWLCKDYDKAWKVCNKCGREFLRDSRNFVKKAKASDGLTSRCKWCDKEIRKKN